MKARLLAILAFGATMLALDAGGTAFSQGGGNSGPGSAVPNGPRIQRSQTCIVDDPTGTPLNVRERPHGSIVGALRNGTPVAAFNSVSDKDGRQWVYVAPLAAGKRGWVFRDYLDCRGALR